MKHQAPLNFSLIKRILGYTAAAKGTRNVLFGLTLLRAMQLPLLAWGTGAVINGPITSGDGAMLLPAVLGYAAFALFTDFTFRYRILFALRFGEQVMSEMRQDLFAHFMRMPMSFFTQNRTGSLISRLTSDIEAIRMGVQDALFISIVQGGQMLVAGALMLWVEPQLFVIVLAVAPSVWFLNRQFRKRQSVLLRKMQESFSKVTAVVAEAVGGIRVTQGFSRQSVNAGIFRELVADHSQHNIGAARNNALYTPLLELNAQFFTAALILAGGWRALSPDVQMPIGDVVMFIFLANLFFQPFQVIGNQYAVALSAMAGAERVFGMLDTPPAWEDADEARPMPRIEGRVEFRGVHFSYDPEKPVLHDISFVAEPGTTVALVGHTGSGKTSIINLISKYYLCQEGEVLIDGRNLVTVTGESLHKQMGIVTQQNFLFTGTLLENLRLGNPEATAEQALEAAERLGCREELETLGLNRIVSEQGGGISLGQRQLVCIVRAMLADPRILILDEATSAVDSLTEARIQRALEILFKGRTSFVIAHRLSTIRKASQVLVLEHGRIIERGDHEALIAQKGQYARMYAEFLKTGIGD